MHSLASSPVHRFPRKFTSKEMMVPVDLNLRIMSMAVFLVFSQRARVIPVVWKQVAARYMSSGNESTLML